MCGLTAIDLILNNWSEVGTMPSTQLHTFLHLDGPIPTPTSSQVGYGDIVAYNIYEKLTAIFIILSGATLFAYFMGSM